jgi:hypothetical protein
MYEHYIKVSVTVWNTHLKFFNFLNIRIPHPHKIQMVDYYLVKFRLLKKLGQIFFTKIYNPIKLHITHSEIHVITPDVPGVQYFNTLQL